MHTVWAMLLGDLVSPRVGEAAAGATVFLFFPLLLSAIYGWARENSVLEKRWALIAVLMVATVPTAYHVASSAYIDLALALFITLAIQALGRWWKTLEIGLAGLCGYFPGRGALGKADGPLRFRRLCACYSASRAAGERGCAPDRTANIFATGFVALLAGRGHRVAMVFENLEADGQPDLPVLYELLEGRGDRVGCRALGAFPGDEFAIRRVRERNSRLSFVAVSRSRSWRSPSSRRFLTA